MKIFSFVIVMTVVFMPGSANAQWHEHTFAELGVAMQFPTAPDVQDGEYQTVVIGDVPVPAVILSADADNVHLKATVADLRAPDIVVNGANIMAECYFVAEQEGRVLENVAHRAEDGTAYGVHGRIVDVEIEGEAALRPAASSQMAVFSNLKRRPRWMRRKSTQLWQRVL